MPDAAGKYSLSTPHEETEREVEREEEHQIEGEDSQAPLQPFQGLDLELTHSNYILDSENALLGVSIQLGQTPFNKEWEQQIEEQLDTMFQLPETP